MKLPAVFSLFLLLLLSCQNFPIDTAMSADEGRALTLVLGGCGKKDTRGYLFIEKNEGDGTSCVVTATVPAVKCSRSVCGRWQVVMQDGSYGLGGSLPLGASTFSVRLKDLLGHSEDLGKADDGEMSIMTELYFTTPDGVEHHKIMQARVRLVVQKTGYESLACNDRVVAFSKWVNSQCLAQYTTQLRSTTCGPGCE